MVNVVPSLKGNNAIGRQMVEGIANSAWASCYTTPTLPYGRACACPKGIGIAMKTQENIAAAGRHRRECASEFKVVPGDSAPVLEREDLMVVKNSHSSILKWRQDNSRRP